MELRGRLILLINTFLASKDKGITIENDIEDIEMVKLNLDSIEFIELIVELEEEFDCEFDDSMLGNDSFISLNSLTAYLSKITQKK